MDFFQSPHYRVNKRLLFYLGLWPLQKPKERFIFRFTTLLLIGSIFVPKLIRFGEYMGNLNGMIQCLPNVGLHAVSVTKFFNFSVNAKQMKQLVNRIKEDCLERSANNEGAIIDRYAQRARKLTVMYTAYLYAMLCTYLLLPTIPIFLDIIMPLNQSRDHIFLYETEYFIDQDKYYFLILIHTYITMPVSVGMIIAFDTMFAVYVHHACGIFATLGSSLEKIGHDGHKDLNEISLDSAKTEDITYEKIVKCIKMHKKAIEFAALLESTTSGCFLFVIGICMLMISLTGFMTVTNLDEPSEALRFSAFGTSEIIHLFYLCWQGQMLMEHSEQIFIDAYNVEWCGASIRAKKLLIMIMIRSSVPCQITAGKIYILSMENFSTVRCIKNVDVVLHCLTIDAVKLTRLDNQHLLQQESYESTNCIGSSSSGLQQEHPQQKSFSLLCRKDIAYTRIIKAYSLHSTLFHFG